MNALFHTSWLPAVGWALLHSLWEGIVVVLLVALALRCLRGSTPRMRYAVAVFGLILMAGLPIRHLVSLHPDPKPMVLARRSLDEDAQVLVQSTPTKAPLIRSAITSNLGKALPWVVAAWILGVCLSLIRLAGGWLWLQRMRWVKSELAPDLLQGRLLALCRRAGLKRAVTLLMCEGLTGPSVVGVLRPAILVPAGWFLNLPPDYVEALLAHELAHVLRHDYAVNLLQSLLEVVMFYHPGVWWLSRRIRAERELACDTFAARLMGDPLPLAEALTALERRGLGHASPELSPAAHGGSLMERISHLLLPPHRTSSAPAFGAVAILALLLVSGLHVVAQTPDPSPVVHPEIQHRLLKVPKADGKTITEHPPAIYIHSRNAKDVDGKDIPYTQIMDIEAHQVALYQLWKVFEEAAKDNRPNIEAWVSKDDKFQGPLVDIDLHGAKPEDVFASLNRLAKQFGVGPYQAPSPSEFGPIYVAKYTNKDGQVVLNLHARQVNTAFLDRLLVTARDLPPGSSAGFERGPEESDGPKLDAIFEGLTLQQLEARVRKLQTEQL